MFFYFDVPFDQDFAALVLHNQSFYNLKVGHDELNVDELEHDEV